MDDILEIKPVKKEFIQLPDEECTRIALLHREGGYSLKITAHKLGMNVSEFGLFLMSNSNLRQAICKFAKIDDRYYPFGKPRRSYEYKQKDSKEED